MRNTALVECLHNAQDGPHHPGIEHEHVGFFLGIPGNVEQVRRLQFPLAFIDFRLPVEMELPVTPFDSAQLALDVEQEAFAGAFFCAPNRKADWSIPSIGRSSGMDPPATTASVVKRSVTWTISLLILPGSILPGQLAMNGTRSEPSIAV